MDSKRNKLSFDGNGDVRKFLTKVELEAALKGHENEKKSSIRC